MHLNNSIKVWLILFCVSVFFACGQHESIAQDQKQNNWLIQDLTKKWEANKAYSIAVLEAMPEEHYDFIPAEGMKSFKEQAAHITNGFSYQMGPIGNKSIPSTDETDKAAIIASYELIFDNVIEYIKKIDPKDLPKECDMWYGKSSTTRNINLMDNHLAHHRGQMIVYLRLKGITPPKYIGW